MLLEKLNKKSVSTVAPEVSTEGYEFKNLSDFIGRELVLDGFIITNGQYGRRVALVAEGCFINLPTRYVSDFDTIKNDPTLLKAVTTHHAAVTNIKTITTRNGSTTVFDFKDI